MSNIKRHWTIEGSVTFSFLAVVERRPFRTQVSDHAIARGLFRWRTRCHYGDFLAKFWRERGFWHLPQSAKTDSGRYLKIKGSPSKDLVPEITRCRTFHQIGHFYVMIRHGLSSLHSVFFDCCKGSNLSWLFPILHWKGFSKFGYCPPSYHSQRHIEYYGTLPFITSVPRKPM